MIITDDLIRAVAEVLYDRNDDNYPHPYSNRVARGWKKLDSSFSVWGDAEAALEAAQEYLTKVGK